MKQDMQTTSSSVDQSLTSAFDQIQSLLVQFAMIPTDQGALDLQTNAGSILDDLGAALAARGSYV